MKLPIIITLLICSVLTSIGQKLHVTYSEKMDLTEKLKAIEDPAIRQMVMQQTGKPKYYELISKDGVSLYRRKAATSEQNLDNNVTIIQSGAEKVIYRDSKNKSYVKQTDFLSRKFLIKDQLKKLNWKIANETLKIDKYLCKKATLKKENKVVTAWFTNQIPSNQGPDEYYGLPGLILKVQTGSRIIEASHISFSKKIPDIEIPTKGKKVTQAEYDKIVKEKVNDMTGGEGQEEGSKEVKVIKM